MDSSCSTKVVARTIQEHSLVVRTGLRLFLLFTVSVRTADEVWVSTRLVLPFYNKCQLLGVGKRCVREGVP